MAHSLQEAAAALIGCLREQADQFSRFLDLLTRQRAALVAGDTVLMEAIAAQQERMIGHAQLLESRRQSLTEQLVAYAADGSPESRRFPAQGITLAEVSRLVEASKATELAGLQERLRGLQAEIEGRRKLNATLIHKSMRRAEEAFRWMAGGSTQRKPTYSQNGKRVGDA